MRKIRTTIGVAAAALASATLLGTSPAGAAPALSCRQIHQNAMYHSRMAQWHGYMTGDVVLEWYHSDVSAGYAEQWLLARC